MIFFKDKNSKIITDKKTLPQVIAALKVPIEYSVYHIPFDCNRIIQIADLEETLLNMKDDDTVEVDLNID
jgi:hypothetical protein